VDNFCLFSDDHEPFIWNFLKLGKGETFIDIGAHVGKYTIAVAKAAKDSCRVVAIEPAPKNYATLLRNIRLNGLSNVIPLNIACWKKPCNIKLYIANDSEGYSTKVTKGDYVLVRARTLDAVVKDLGIESIALIKIDVEGAELEVLQGMREILSTMRPKIILEVFKKNFEQVAKLLQRHSYMYKVIPGSAFLAPEPGIYLWCIPT